MFYIQKITNMDNTAIEALKEINMLIYYPVIPTTNTTDFYQKNV